MSGESKITDSYFKKFNKKSFLHLIAMILSFYMIALYVFSVAQIGHEHENSSGGTCCLTCIQIKETKNIIKQLTFAVATIVFVIATLFLPELLFNINIKNVTFFTPVQLKVRLNN